MEAVTYSKFNYTALGLQGAGIQQIYTLTGKVNQSYKFCHFVDMVCLNTSYDFEVKKNCIASVFLG